MPSLVKVIERSTGAVLLPQPAGESADKTSWMAFAACDADLRAKHPEWAAVAADLVVARE